MPTTKTKLSEAVVEEVYNVIADGNGLRTVEVMRLLPYSFTTIICACDQLHAQDRISKGAAYYYNKQGKQVDYYIWLVD